MHCKQTVQIKKMKINSKFHLGCSLKGPVMACDGVGGGGQSTTFCGYDIFAANSVRTSEILGPIQQGAIIFYTSALIVLSHNDRGVVALIIDREKQV